MSESTQAQEPAHREYFKVRYRDTDAQGHLYFANYLVFADEAAGTYMTSLGFDWSAPAGTPCLVFTVNINIDYLNECRIEDTVRAEVGYSRLGNSSAQLDFALYNDACGTALARGHIRQVFVDRESRRSTPIPAALRTAILARQPGLANGEPGPCTTA